MLARLGHIPTGAGESVTLDGWVLVVAGIDHRAITKVRLSRVPEESDTDTDTEQAAEPVLDEARS